MTAEAAPRRRLGFGFWGFIVVMLGLTALFAWLGLWQVDRLHWKETLIAQVNARLTQPPYELPRVELWPQLDLDAFSFHPLTVTGHYLPEKTVLVFASLSSARGKYDGPGYWVMTPVAADGGGTVFVNRGFIPQSSASAFANGGAAPQGEQIITGIGVAPEEPEPFTPGPDKAKRVEYVRDPVRLAAMAEVQGPALGITLDAPAADPGALPQGGETTIEFPNNHFGYALTWFGFAGLTPILLLVWIWRQLRPKTEANAKADPNARA